MSQILQLNFREFDLNTLYKYASIAVIGECGSWVARSIIEHLATTVSSGIIIAPTDKQSKFYESFFPKTHILYEYGEFVFQKILDSQAEDITDVHTRYQNNKSFVLIDGLINSHTVRPLLHDNALMEIIFNGKCYEFTYILTLQPSVRLSREMTGSFDYIFLLASDSPVVQKQIYELYGGWLFESFESFMQVFTQLTKSYGVVIVIIHV